jgi:hypothetical protein
MFLWTKSQNDTDHQVAGVISPLSKRTVRRLWCIRLFVRIGSDFLPNFVSNRQDESSFDVSMASLSVHSALRMGESYVIYSQGSSIVFQVR